MTRKYVSNSVLFRSPFVKLITLSLSTASLGFFLNLQQDAFATTIIDTLMPDLNAGVYLAQSSWSNALNRLNTHVEANHTYFDNYALSAANAIASGEKVNWRIARMNIDDSNGNILLSLAGNAVIPGMAGLFIPAPEMELYILFAPNECFQYSYTDYRLGVSGSFASIIQEEVAVLLAENKSAMERSLNNEVYYTLASVQSLASLGCD